MADTRGTFRLKNVRSDILNNEYVPLPSVYVGDNQSVGYIKMYGPSQWKLNFTTSTTTASSHLTASKYLQAGTSNPTYAWFVGGQPGPISDSKKITYASDTAADNPSSRLLSPRSSVGAISGESHSYLMGGIPYTLSTVSKLTHANDTMVDLPGSQLAASKYMASSGHGGGAHGYIFTGMPGYTYSETQRITFANDTRTTLPSSSRMVWLSENPNSGYNNSIPYWGAGNLQCPTHCYYAGGNPGAAEFTSTFQKLTFASETWAVSPSKMARSMRYISGITASSSKGCIAGGAMGPHGVAQSKVDLVTYATDSWATEPSMQLGSIPGAGQYTTYGASAATGLNDSLHPGPSGLPRINKRWFDDAPTSNMDFYYGGGFHPWDGSNIVSTFFKITDSTDTHSNIGNMPVAKSGFVFRGNDTDARITGGDPYYPVGSRTEKFTYSSTTFEALPSSSNLNSRYAKNAGGIGTKQKMIVAGGGPTPSGKTNFEKLTYGTDTWSVVTPSSNYLSKGSLSNAGLECSHAGGNSTHGYIMGKYGTPSPSYTTMVDKYTYSDDTCTNIPGVYSNQARGGSSAASDTALYAFAYGGYSYPGKAMVPKLTFTTDTVSVVSASLTSSKYYTDQGGSGNRSHGRLMNFGSPYDNSYAYKFDYTTETWSTANPSGNVKGGMTTNAVEWIGAPLVQPLPETPTPSTTLTGPQGIKAEGYLIQGIQGPTSDSGRSDSYKLDYSTETWSSSANSTLTRKTAGATSTTTNAYVAGGELRSADGSSPTGADMDKYTYATSTFSRIPGSDAGDIPGPGNANKQCAAGNQTQGYWAFSTAQSRCSKLTYSNDTGSNLPNLPWNAKYSVGVSMQTAGYYGAGSGFDDKFTSFVKITFSNETYSTHNGWYYSGSGTQRNRCASSSSTKAYIVGGVSSPRQVDITPWATNSTSNSPTTFLASPGFYKAPGQGSNEAGYFTGGANTGNNGTTTEKITYASDTTAIVPSAYFSSSHSSGINSYSTGGPNMNGLGTNVPNVI